jgi:N-acyl-L-homoserine lactone synthetase
LRYRYFVCQRQWVQPDELHDELHSDVEWDHYDSSAYHLAVFDEDKPVAYLRLLDGQAPCGIMLGHEFAELVPPEKKPLLCQAHSVELSRLVVASPSSSPSGINHNRQSKAIMELLLNLLYWLALQQGFEQFFIVVEPSWLRPFSRRFGLNFQPLGPSLTFPDGTQTVAAYARLPDMENAIEDHNPEKLAWYKSTE